jgi:hypothetical protein
MKKFGIVTSMLVSSVFALAALSFASGQKNPEDLMFEAAQKRVKLKGLVLSGEDASKKVTWEEKSLLKKTYIAVFTDILVQESLQKEPKILVAAKDRVLKREPKLYRIKVDGESGEQIYKVLSSSASACSKVPSVVQVGTVEETAKLLCLDPVLDDMSFAAPGAKLRVETMPLTAIETFPEVGAYYDQLVEAELKALVTEKFLGVYSKTGKVSLL